METINEKKAYEFQMSLFIQYIIGKLSKKFFDKLDESYKKNFNKTFIEFMLEENCFTSEQDALDFGRYVKNYFFSYKKLPKGIPDKNIWEQELM